MLMIFDSDLRESFYVGDAAGRLGDHSKDDLSLARALSIAFYTPEVSTVINHALGFLYRSRDAVGTVGCQLLNLN